MKTINTNTDTNTNTAIVLTKQDRMDAYDMIFGDDDDFIDSFLEEPVKEDDK